MVCRAVDSPGGARELLTGPCSQQASRLPPAEDTTERAVETKARVTCLGPNFSFIA